MKSDFFVTVITPTYNREKTLERTVKSVLAQTYTNFEYVIVDDGSRDNTVSLMDRLILSDPKKRIRFYQHKKNAGQNAALNTGLNMANGELVAFLDSDDEWLPDMLEKQVRKFIDNPEIGCSYTWSARYEGDQLVTIREYNIEGSIYKEALEQGYVSGPITLMVKRECLVAIGGFNNEFTVCQDDDLCFQLAKKYKFALVKKALAIIHDDAGNQTIKNARAYADGWTKLFVKYEADIVQYCGHKTMARHFLKCAKLYVKSQDAELVRVNARRSISHYPTLVARTLLAFSYLPVSTQSLLLKLFRKTQPNQ